VRGRVLRGAAAALAAAARTGAQRVSDEQRSTFWAYSVSTAPVRARPAVDGRKIGKLRLLTESDFAESYLVLDRWTDGQGQEWVRIRLPGRPNGRTGWVSRAALGTLRRTTVSIEVRRATRRLLVRRNGRVVLRARIGVGKRGTPTPAGRFWVRERYAKLRGGGIYGARALGTSAYAPYLTDWPRGGVVGIHGTDQPGLLPGAVSHGCIRLRDADVIRVHRLAGVGTPIWIR
jgi:hypothetical protein